MIDTSELPPSIRREAGHGGLACYTIENSLGRAQIYEHGAHVTFYQPASSSQPILWLSSRSAWDEEHAMRGGVPLCFPWFGPKADDSHAPPHGIARTGRWELQGASEGVEGTRLLFGPSSQLEESRYWPRDCRVSCEVLVGASLQMSFEVANGQARTREYEIAMHSYLRVGDVRTVEVRGLEGAPFWDKVARSQQPGQKKVVSIAGEVDRVYTSASTCTLHDKAWRREITVEKESSGSTVVWNPGEKKAGTMADFGAGEWSQMLCIETANVGSHRIRLAPGGTHRTMARLSAREL